MIGLKRHTVRLVEHHPSWASLYEEEARAIRAAAGDALLDVQHVGSTAVPGLPAKPILDIAVAVSGPDSIPCLVKRLVAIGYIDRGDAGRDGGYLLVKESHPEVRTVHIHIVCEDDIQWRNYIEFRGVLRRDPALRRQYAALKTDLAVRFPDDRKAYTDGKHAFIRGVLAALCHEDPSA